MRARRGLANRWVRGNDCGAKLGAVPGIASHDEVCRLMAEFRGGSAEAAGKLVEAFYPELRRLASSRMVSERADHTWEPTVLVHELYLELRRVKSLPAEGAGSEDERKAFFGLAAFLMRRLLAHHARPLPQRILKTGIDEALTMPGSGEDRLVEMERLLDRLGAIDPKLRSVVEMKVFEGLSREEIGERLGCSVRSVARHWDFARQWLQGAMG